MNSYNQKKSKIYVKLEIYFLKTSSFIQYLIRSVNLIKEVLDS
jgi:hypothetical protein